MSWKIASDTVLLSLVRHIYSHDDDDDYKWYNSNASVLVYVFVWIQIRNGKQGASLPITKDEPTPELYLVNSYGFADGSAFNLPHADKILKPNYSEILQIVLFTNMFSAMPLHSLFWTFYHSNNSKLVCEN
uniref:Uncharacterized protein n=1 Tax=Glossina palpalis gambiensis TaxID=67801 RepID=A0A1B0B1D5_9MUSC